MSTLNDIWKNRLLILEGIGNFMAKKQVIEDIAKERFSVCKSCPVLNLNCTSIADCCGICGCNLELKTRSLKSSCPKNKWQAINTNQ